MLFERQIQPRERHLEQPHAAERPAGDPRPSCSPRGIRPGTSASGTWDRTAVRPGFDWFASFTGWGAYFNANFLVNGKSVRADKWTDDRTGDLAVRFLERERAKDKPFLLVVGFKARTARSPRRLGWRRHSKASWLAERRTSACVPGSTPTSPPMAKEAGDRVPVNVNYFRCIAGVDENVGKVLDALDRLKLSNNTVVVYASDNGFYLGEHSLADKRSGYDESLRIRSSCGWPKSGLAGVTRDDLVLNIDLAPTFLDLAGVAVPKDMHGKSWKPLLARTPRGSRSARASSTSTSRRTARRRRPRPSPWAVTTRRP